MEAAASIKSFQPKEDATKHKKRHRYSGSKPGDPDSGRNADVNFRGERHLNDTHASTTDPDARLAKIKGKEAKLSYGSHILAENRHGLITQWELTRASAVFTLACAAFNMV